jgi:hypothetical protein
MNSQKLKKVDMNQILGSDIIGGQYIPKNMQFSDKQDWAIHNTEKDSSLSSSTLIGEVEGHGGPGAPNRRQGPPVAPVLQAQAPSSSAPGGGPILHP